ncbi:hypothetical protein F0562_002543 [Nyssa sinensis]|uniref:N-acetyltransferase domain-containing protein n=1 Tax=Nyssa sinensis TaxID=561372 RepID=A0A5J5C6R1_9ASTE|nr:hypothetical protein F0562_002543 [Nyssa sinensis]
MADSTRSQDIRRIEDAIRHLKESSDKQAEAMVGIKDLVLALNLKYEQILKKVSSFSSSVSPIIPTREPTNNQNQWQTRFAKLDFSKFFGEDLEDWVYKCEKFFEFSTIDETQKVRLALMRMEDRAIYWFRWYEKTHILRSWRKFVGALIARFGDSLFDDAMGQLTKLRQISTIKTYQEKFEELANKTNGLSEEFLVSCFVSGLKDEIKAGVQMFRPKNVFQAMGLARLQEETIEALAKKNRVYSKNYNSSFPTSSRSVELAPNPMESATAVKKMTQKELEEKWMKGLCYGWDTAVTAADTMLRDRDAILKLWKEHLVQSQQKMKQQADKHRYERVFAVGDWVYFMGKVEGQGESWHGHVTAVTVAPEFRRQQLAKKLMNLLEDISDKIDKAYFVDLFVRASNTPAIKMYEKLGYIIYRRVLRYYSGEEDGLDMRKALSRDVEKKSIIPLKRPVTPDELEYD